MKFGLFGFGKRPGKKRIERGEYLRQRRTPTKQDHRNAEKEDLEVEEYRLVFDVVEIKKYHFFEANGASPPASLVPVPKSTLVYFRVSELCVQMYQPRDAKSAENR